MPKKESELIEYLYILKEFINYKFNLTQCQKYTFSLKLMITFHPHEPPLSAIAGYTHCYQLN